MPKDPTPYQLSKNLQYVQKEAPFLAKLKAKHPDPVKKKFEDWNPEGDDDEYDEFQGAQVVVLKEGKHYSEEDLQRHLRGEEVDLTKPTKDDSIENTADDDKAVDENGRIMFRSKKRPVDGLGSSVTMGSKAIKRKHTDAKSDNAEIAPAPDESKKKKKKEKKKKEAKLSFDIEDE
ncbi:hypothetical protein BGW37DRAFT_531119 [Umbelopsis sp. PMI_123]|nr:hypothetical protein BGW37DRAFT_531119 [Umbelopsis sp. PMI_123]